MTVKSRVLDGLLVLSYVLLVAPLGMLLRLLGFDPLKRRQQASASSYWQLHSRTPMTRGSFRRQY